MSKGTSDVNPESGDAGVRALRLHRSATDGEPPDVTVDDLPAPVAGPTDVVVDVDAATLGMRERQLAFGDVSYVGDLPRVLGGGGAGTVSTVGSAVDDWRPGDRVALLPSRPCGRCSRCVAGRDNLCVRLRTRGVDVDGTLTTSVLAGSDELVPIPPGVDAAVAAFTVDSAATAYHALKRAGVGDGSTIAVIGVGAVGSAAVVLARLAGAAVVAIDVDPEALARADVLGADEVVDAVTLDPVEHVRGWSEGGVDRAVEFVGRPATIAQAVELVASGGRAVVAGFGPEPVTTLPVTRFAKREVELVGSAGPTVQDVNELLDLLDTGRLDLAAAIVTTSGLAAAADELRRSPAGGPVGKVVRDL